MINIVVFCIRSIMLQKRPSVLTDHIINVHWMANTVTRLRKLLWTVQISSTQSPTPTI